MKSLAPIGLSTYSRLKHLKQTIVALQNNTLAKDSELYIFSDAAKSGDEKVVAEVRKYIHTIDGFKNVQIIERETNGRVANNRGGMKQLLDEYGKIIFMEEDIVTAPGFLEFMNRALEFYENDDSILSISGFGLPILIENYPSDIYALSRFNAWGLGIWQKKFKLVDYITEKEYAEFLNDKDAVTSFAQGGGEDMLRMLKLEMSGGIDTFDVKAMFCQFKNKMLTVYPKNSLVQNIGHDGSGIHCGETDRFHHDKLWNKLNGFKFLAAPQVDEKIRKANYIFRKQSAKERARIYLKKVGIYSLLRRLKSRLR